MLFEHAATGLLETLPPFAIISSYANWNTGVKGGNAWFESAIFIGVRIATILNVSFYSAAPISAHDFSGILVNLFAATKIYLKSGITC